MNQNKSFLLICFTLLLLLFTYLLYYIGVSQEFILDDIPNLKNLSFLSNTATFNQYLNFIFFNILSNGNGSGRFVSYFTFALQSSSWPNAVDFKLFNINLHLLNGLLIYWLSIRLTKQTLGSAHFPLAIVITFFWLIAPIQVDTVQYTIQRMAMLSSFFMLLGLITFTYARPQLEQAKKKSLFLLYPVFGLCFILAVFSKENGILLTLLILIFEFALYRQAPKPVYYKIWFILTIFLPLVLFLALILNEYERYFFYTYREFSPLERVWTQQTILAHYLSSIIAPSTSKLTLFYDDFIISKSLLSPLSTLFYLLMHLGLIVISFFTLKRWPLFAAGILFFYANHLLESTFMPLELYFEHRNYLAVFGVSLSLFTLPYYLSKTKSFSKIGFILYSIPGLILLLSIWVNYNQNILWSNPLLQSAQWYEGHFSSNRAHGNFGQQLVKNGRSQKALSLYQNTLDKFPHDPTKTLLWLETNCNPEIRPLPPIDETLKRARNGTFYHESIQILKSLIVLLETKRCPGVENAYFLEIVDSFLENKHYSSRKAQLSLLVIKYRAYQLNSNYSKAAQTLEKAIKINDRLDILIGLAEKYIYLKEFNKATLLMSKIDKRCHINSVKCANMNSNIRLLKQIYQQNIKNINYHQSVIQHEK